MGSPSRSWNMQNSLTYSPGAHNQIGSAALAIFASPWPPSLAACDALDVYMTCSLIGHLTEDNAFIDELQKQ